MRPRLISGESIDSSDAPSFVNIGVWGPGPTNYADFVRVNRELEHKVRSLGGIKWLYAQGYYTQDEFDEIYDRKWYEAIREKYHATYLPTVYEKVNVDLTVLEKQKGLGEWARGVVWDTWPVSGVYGVLKTLVESDYLLKK
jgi:delta24-sterol reductase